MACLCICRDLTMESWTSGGESLHAQEDNLVIIYGVNAQGEAEMAEQWIAEFQVARGIPMQSQLPQAIGSRWNKYYVEGPAVEQQEIILRE